MTISQLVSELSAYPDDMEAVVMVDYGTGYLLHPPTHVGNSSEFRDDETDRVVVMLMNMVDAPIVQWRNIDPVCASCGLVVPEERPVEKEQLDLFDD
tara:strand:+ start:844 stop:1134 length:291 start_codon:yes stop_codon:yes gene_type:complete